MEYTFNGLGEFTFVLVDNTTTVMFELQARTLRVVDSNTQELTNATYISAVAARHGDNSQVISYWKYTIMFIL